MGRKGEKYSVVAVSRVGSNVYIAEFPMRGQAVSFRRSLHKHSVHMGRKKDFTTSLKKGELRVFRVGAGGKELK